MWLEERIERQIKAESGACPGQAVEEYSDDIRSDRQDAGCMFRCGSLIFKRHKLGSLNKDKVFKNRDLSLALTDSVRRRM